MNQDTENELYARLMHEALRKGLTAFTLGVHGSVSAYARKHNRMRFSNLPIGLQKTFRENALLLMTETLEENNAVG